MNSITFKETLMQALHKAAEYFNAGSTPDDAVAKSASEYNFNVDQTSRLVETFNTARTIYHYKTAADRSSEFRLANKDGVLAIMYAKEPEAKAATAPDYSQYDQKEQNYRQDTVLDARGFPELKFAAHDFLDSTIDTQAVKAMTILNVQRDLAETARHEANTFAIKAAEILSEVAADLRRGYIEDCVARYSRLCAACKEPVMAKLAEHMPSHIKAQPVDGLVDDRDLQEYVTRIKDAAWHTQVESEMLAVAGQLHKEADQFEREFFELLCFLPQKKAESLGDLVSPGFFKRAKGDAGIGGISGGGGVGSMLGSLMAPAETPMLDKAITQSAGSAGRPLTAALINSPTKQENKQLSERLRNVQRQLILEELMSNDPVLSEAEPNKVITAYQSLMHMAPEVSTNKEVVRAILRSATQSVAISPYDASTWAQLEKTMKEVTGGLPRQPTLMQPQEVRK